MDEFPASSQGWNESSLHPSVFALPPGCVRFSLPVFFGVQFQNTSPSERRERKEVKKEYRVFCWCCRYWYTEVRGRARQRFERREHSEFSVHILEQLCICISLSDWSYWIRSIRLQMYRLNWASLNAHTKRKLVHPSVAGFDWLCSKLELFMSTCDWQPGRPIVFGLSSAFLENCICTL